MASTRDIQRRIRLVGSIGKVTRAMEAVSASKMRRAQAATLASRAYARTAAEVISCLRWESASGVPLHPLLKSGSTGRPAVVLITPDRGLTGGLVLQIIRFAVRRARSELGADVAWVAVGRKGQDFLVRQGQPLIAQFTELPDHLSPTDLAPVAHLILDDFRGGIFRSVHIAYSGFDSLVRHHSVLEPLLPVPMPPEEHRVRSRFAFEPSAEAILDKLVPRLLEMRIYQAVLEARASEHSARMVAMRSATDAASDLRAALVLSYNKARQSEITSELLDIAGGAEAQREARRPEGAARGS